MLAALIVYSCMSLWACSPLLGSDSCLAFGAHDKMDSPPSFTAKPA